MLLRTHFHCSYTVLPGMLESFAAVCWAGQQSRTTLHPLAEASTQQPQAIQNFQLSPNAIQLVVYKVYDGASVRVLGGRHHGGDAFREHGGDGGGGLVHRRRRARWRASRPMEG